MPHSATLATRLGAELKARILPQRGDAALAPHKSSCFCLEQGGENRWSSLSLSLTPSLSSFPSPSSSWPHFSVLSVYQRNFTYIFTYLFIYYIFLLTCSSLFHAFVIYLFFFISYKLTKLEKHSWYKHSIIWMHASPFLSLSLSLSLTFSLVSISTLNKDLPHISVIFTTRYLAHTTGHPTEGRAGLQVESLRSIFVKI